MEGDFEHRVHRASEHSLGRLLLDAARLFNEHALSAVRAETGLDIRPVHTALLPHIGADGARLTELAARVGITRQAVARHVAELEAQGLVERVPDPADGRASVVRFAAGGRDRLLEGLRALGRVEARAAARLGPERVELLRRTLGDLVRSLTPTP